MDFFGPLSYRIRDNTIGKYWMKLSTCLNTRAIAPYAPAIYRHYRCPTWLICDNALSFESVANCYASTITRDNHDDVLDYCAKKNIEVKFIPALSPCQGGIYEKNDRLVQKVSQACYRITTSRPRRQQQQKSQKRSSTHVL
ncbi:hypothetical protein RB195_024038 [Necator americanus]|uniref:Integrase catalytic domain-containing protein n=1 Tax=Necator americanus TaxID=51031 RepID=A0ABR1ELI6_NECAM